MNRKADMSNEPGNPPTSAADVLEQNAALDREILDREYPAAMIRMQPPARDDDPDPWTAAEQLSHIAEFQRFFSGQLEAWLEDPAVEIGRTHEHAERLAAIEAAAGRSPAELVDDVRSASESLAATLAKLEDDHLTADTNNVKYGSEPLTSFLGRYVVGHKRAHVKQLDDTLTAAKAMITLGGATRTLGTP